MAGGFVRHDGLWMPSEGKHAKGGNPGTYFDDELETAEAHFLRETQDLVNHINERPDHVVYVASKEDRARMREVFNHWKRIGRIGHNPNIRIDYGVPDGGIRVGEAR